MRNLNIINIHSQSLGVTPSHSIAKLFNKFFYFNLDQMKNPNYICAKCKLPFTRKWNAIRHCNNKHSGINQKDFASSLNGFNHHSINKKNQTFYDNPVSINSKSTPPSLDPFEKFIENELLPYKLLEQLGPNYEEIQRLLDFMPEPNRKILISCILSIAIISNNPLETMSIQLQNLRKNKTTNMMFNDLKSSYGLDNTSMKEFLKLIWKYNKT